MFFYKKSTWQDSQGGRYEAYEVLRSVFCEDSQKWETVDATPSLWMECGDEAHRKIDVVEAFVESRNAASEV